MPTIAELEQLRNSQTYENVIKKTGWGIWSAETRGSEAAFFDFYIGVRFWILQSNSLTLRAQRSTRISTGSTC
jgi:hypothetical protein